MDKNDLIEKRTDIQDVDYTEVESGSGPDITSVIDGEIQDQNVQENTAIVADDFDIDPAQLDQAKPGAEKKEEKKETVSSAPASGSDQPGTDRKSEVMARVLKPNVLFTFYNSMAGRIGRVANKNNPDCLKLTKEDTEDLGVILQETVKEENWSGVPSKWLLLIAVAMIIASKIFMWNRKPENVSAANSKEIEEMKLKLTEWEKKFSDIEEQNKLLKSLLEKKMGSNNSDPPSRMFRGQDLTRLKFSENGAIIDETMAGKKGWSSTGKKMGTPSHEEQELYEAWKMYHEFFNQEEAA